MKKLENINGRYNEIINSGLHFAYCTDGFKSEKKFSSQSNLEIVSGDLHFFYDIRFCMDEENRLDNGDTYQRLCFGIEVLKEAKTVLYRAAELLREKGESGEIRKIANSIMDVVARTDKNASLIEEVIDALPID